MSFLHHQVHYVQLFDLYLFLPFYQFFQMIPYLATVVVLAIIGSSKAGPKANGVAYRKEQR